MPSEHHQIFYDRFHVRWLYARLAFGVVTLLLAVVFGLTVSGVFHRVALPVLSLVSPSASLRDAPDALRTTPSQLPPASTRAATVAALEAAKKRSQADGRPYVPENFAFYVNWDDNSLVSLREHIDGIDTLIPEWLHLADASGAVRTDDPDRQALVLGLIRDRRPDLRVTPLVNNYDSDTQDWDGELIARMLVDPAARAANISALLDFVRQGGFSGINIDYENIPDTSQPALVAFMGELYAAFHPLGLTVSQDIPIDDDSYDVRALSAVSDLIVLMAYDENSAADTSPGPVAGQEWFTDALTQRFSSLSSEKYAVSLGSYGYEWNRGEETSGATVTYQDALQTARAAKAEIEFETDSLNPTFDYYDHDALRSVWYLDAATFYNQVAVSLRLGNPRGFALWRMGSEDPDVWRVLSARGALDGPLRQELGTMEYGYDVSYLGQGEVLRVSATPAVGRREFDYDEARGLITDERVTAMPSGYVIDRWGGGDSKKIALTFDDGPDAEYTPQILDILARYGAHATFFSIGQNASVRPDILRRAVAQGNEVGSHTYTHPNITTIPDRQLFLELDANQRLFEGVLGRKTLLFRPPYAEDIEPATPEQVRPLVTVSDAGYYVVAMHIDPNDWASPGTDAIVSGVIDGAVSGQGDIVLLHDGGGNRDQTVAALSRIIEGLQSRGFQLVTVSELMGLPRDDVMPPVVWTKQLSTLVYAAAFYTISGFSNALSWLFVAGIFLGIVRFFFIGTLAIVQFGRARARDRKRHRLRIPPYRPRVSVVVPAYDEEKVIRRTVDAILGSRYPDFDVVIVDDGSNDLTYLTAQMAYGGDPRVRVLTQENRGKAEALNYGIRGTDAEIVVTLDADTIFRPDTIARLADAFEDPAVAAVAGNAKVGNRTNILTKWQALEYVTSQNLDRRAFELMNCITVVPGSVGAWRREAVLAAGGFSLDTLAEDADLTFALLRAGHRVAYADRAIGLTEAPDTVRNFVKQRFRWMYGTFQTVWKHRSLLLRPRSAGALGWVAMPNVLVFQIFFPLVSPVMDLLLVLSLLWVWWQHSEHPLEVSAAFTLRRIFEYYLLFLVIDFLTAVVPLILEKREQWRLLFWLPLQRFFYRQLMYYVAIKSVAVAIKGRVVAWNKFERKATVKT